MDVNLLTLHKMDNLWDVEELVRNVMLVDLLSIKPSLASCLQGKV